MSGDRTVKTSLLNMCMIYDENNNTVLVQDKVKDSDDGWYGYTFPGGHVENGESIINSTIREIKEETGLTITSLIPCGLIDWYNVDSPERWLLFLYKTKNFSGNLLDGTSEGKVFWMDLKEFLNSKMAPDMNTYMKLFLNDNLNEAYATWNRSSNSEFELFN